MLPEDFSVSWPGEMKDLCNILVPYSHVSLFFSLYPVSFVDFNALWSRSFSWSE